MAGINDYGDQRKGARMAADPKRSEGARLERRAVRDYLRRAIKAAIKANDSHRVGLLSEALDWVLDRQDRYDARSGGLGK